MTKKILYFDFWADASSFYQLMPLDYIKHPKLQIDRHTEQDIKPNLINRYDVIILLRPSDDNALLTIRRAKDMHKKVITIFDDDILNIPNDIHPAYDHHKRNKKVTIECLCLSDEVWVTTEAIRYSFRFYNPNIQVIPNAHNDTLFPVDKKPEFKYNKVCLWRGGFSHINDIYAEGITEKLVELINSNKDWKFHFWGQRFEFIELRLKQPNHFRNTGGPPLEFYQSMHMLNPCVFIYPLSDTPFNRSKSNCSLLEAIYSGACYFGSGLPEFDKPGVLPFKDIELYLNDEETLCKNHQKSWQFIKDELLLSRINLIRTKRLLNL